MLNQNEQLRNLDNLTALIGYLRDGLDWPLDADDIHDLTFDYTPDELGLEEEYAAKIRTIKQIRPLVTGQPFGIFYFEFESKRLPVVVMRRILRELVVKKRQTGTAAERAVWDKSDLLFLAATGEAGERRTTFAHFTESESGIPTLKASTGILMRLSSTPSERRWTNSAFRAIRRTRRHGAKRG